MPAPELPEQTRTELRRLMAAADEESRTALHAALKTAKERGWSYKSIGEAVGASHEWVRRTVLKTPGGDAGGLDIPERPRPGKPRQAPAPVLDELAGLLAAAVDAETAERTPNGLRPQVAALFEALADVTAAGWDPMGVGPAIGMHPRAVSRFAAMHLRAGGTANPARYPQAPQDETHTRRTAVPEQIIPDDQSTRMASLGQSANANSNREQAGEYTRLLAYWYLRGTRRAELERASGQEWEAIRFRLSYWGYMAG